MKIIFKLPQHTTPPDVVLVEPVPDIPATVLLNRITVGTITMSGAGMNGALEP